MRRAASNRCTNARAAGSVARARGVGAESAARNADEVAARRHASHASITPRPAADPPAGSRAPRRGARAAPPRCLPGRRSCAPAGGLGPAPAPRGRSSAAAKLPSATRTARRVRRASIAALHATPSARAGASGLARRDHALAHRSRALRRRPALRERRRRRLAELAHEIDPVEQRPAQPARVALAVEIAARAVGAPLRAWAAVARGHEHRPRGVGDGALPAHHGHEAFLERLAQGLERRPARTPAARPGTGRRGAPA